MQSSFVRYALMSIGASALSMLAGHAVAGACESLASLQLKDTKIATAEVVATGAFVPAKPFFMPIDASTYTALPAFCRVAGRIAPTSDSNIGFEVWLPIADWNGKFVAVGNGGYSGEIWYPRMAAPLGGNYVAAATDTGHEGSPVDASFALHPEKLIDYGYRATHELTLKAKAITVAFYGSPPRRAYWNGCSAGGRQGLVEAQRFPADFDGIIAGAPANYMTRLAARYVVVSQHLHKQAGNFIAPEKLPVLHRAVLATCDALDGVQDDVLENPLRCDFDPASLHCTDDADAPNCLTSAQVDSARSVYAPLVHPRTQVELFPGVSAGSELGWGGSGGAVMVSVPSPLRTGIFEFVVFKKKGWDFRTFDVVRDLPIAEDIAGPTLDAIDPDLAPYFDRGGKLLQYHGWADPSIPPLNSIDYYTSVRRTVGDAELDGADSDRSDFDSNYRLFMVPGMEHCMGGAGPDRFDALEALDAWVESGKAPDKIIASRMKDGAVDRTRPLCPYPQIAVYRGEGSTDDAANFACGTDSNGQADLSPSRARRRL